jgi:3-methyladenine DNA glycosylase Mpg
MSSIDTPSVSVETVTYKTMPCLRGVPNNAKPKLLTGGPARLCQAIGITRASDMGLMSLKHARRSRSQTMETIQTKSKSHLALAFARPWTAPCVSW